MEKHINGISNAPKTPSPQAGRGRGRCMPWFYIPYALDFEYLRMRKLQLLIATCYLLFKNFLTLNEVETHIELLKARAAQRFHKLVHVTFPTNAFWPVNYTLSFQ